MMNREERRRADRKKAPGTRGGPPLTIPEDRLAAAFQDFAAGTVFAAGAGGTAAHDTEDDDVDVPNVFFVLVDPDPAYRVAPQLRDLFALQAEIGSEALAEQLQGDIGWGFLDHPDQPLAKVRVRYTTPVKVDVEFLLVAANYRAAWSALTRPHAFGLFLAEHQADTLDAMLEHAIITHVPASHGAQSLGERHGWLPTPRATPPGVVVVHADREGDITVKPFVMDTDDDIVAGIAWTADVFETIGTAADPAAQVYMDRGLPAPTHEVVPEAEGWALAMGEEGFEITDATGEVVVSSTVPDDCPGWVDAVHHKGYLLVAYGNPTRPADLAAMPKGLVPLVVTTHPHRTPPPPPPPAPVPVRSWWHRLFGR